MDSDPIPHKTPDEIKSVLDTIPLPPGARLLDEHVETGQGDATTNVTRTYQIPAGQPACQQLITALGTGWTARDRLGQPLDPATCDPATPNPAFTDPGNDKQRGADLQPATAKTGSVHVEWRRDWLLLSLDEGNLPSPS